MKTLPHNLPAMLLCLLLSLRVAPPAQAHHSFAMFDQSRQTTLKGVVSRLEWANPHTYVVIAVNDHGKMVQYNLECSSPNELTRWGWKPHTLKVGDPVTVSMFPMRDGRPGGLVVSITMSDGTELKAH